MLGLLMTFGSCLYALYTSTGLALLPISFMKRTPSISDPTLRATTAQQLEINQERQRQLEGRCGGNPGLLSSKDRRELDTLTREERTLIRRQRLVEAAQGEGQSFWMRTWYKMETICRPFKLVWGALLLLVTIVTWMSMLVTSIDKARNSSCKHHCGYILGHISLFNPLNWVLVQSASIFPLDYAIFMALVLLFFYSSVAGIAVIGIRFFWIRIFEIRRGHTSPQALLLATVMLMLIILALNYSISMVIAPQYATFGPQTFCDRTPNSPLEPPNCTDSRELVKACSELADSPAAQLVCTPSVASTLLNRVTLGFPVFGAVFFWAQFFFLGKESSFSANRSRVVSGEFAYGSHLAGFYLVFFIAFILRSPGLDERQLDEDTEEAEEEALLATTGRHFNANWQDISDRTSRIHHSANQDLRD